MNRLSATITAIETSDAISLVELLAFDYTFTSVIIDTPDTAPYLRIGRVVTLIFKETEIAIAKNLGGQISLRNRFPSNVLAVTRGAVLSKVTLDFRDLTITSIITTRSANRLNLQPGDAVIGLVKANEMAILADQ